MDVAQAVPVANSMKQTKKIVLSSVIAAIYAVLTMTLYVFSYGPVQLRFSEALTILPVFTPAAIPGLTVGCIIANILGGYGILDVVIGSVATLLAAICTRVFRKNTFLALFSPVFFNSLLVGPMLYFVVPESKSLLFNVLTVGIGELVACFVAGYPFMRLLKKYPKLFEI